MLAALPLGSASADYTLILKSGGHITVGTYTEEDGLVKFRAFGGDVAIGKDQIAAIEKASGPENPGEQTAATQNASRLLVKHRFRPVRNGPYKSACTRRSFAISFN
jgi:hypothetical protein